jgi:hypothetical protein
VGRQKASFIKNDIVDKEDKDVKQHTVGRPWNVVATYDNYQRADDHRKTILVKNETVEGGGDEVKVKRTSKDDFLVKVRSKVAPSGSSKKNKRKRKKAKSSDLGAKTV